MVEASSVEGSYAPLLTPVRGLRPVRSVSFFHVHIVGGHGTFGYRGAEVGEVDG